MQPNTPTIDESFLKAAKEGKHEQVIELLREGAYVDAVDDNDRTALYHAVTEGKLKTAEFLILQGANPDKEYEGKTLIEIIAYGMIKNPNLENDDNRRNLIEFLYTFGADVRKESLSENPDEKMKECIEKLNYSKNIP